MPARRLRGPPGYFDFIENIARKQGKKAKEALDWYGGPYDPNDIDTDQIDITLRRSPTPTDQGDPNPSKNKYRVDAWRGRRVRTTPRFRFIYFGQHDPGRL